MDLLSTVGQCDNGFACVYQNNLSWSSPTTPLPSEAHPRIVFETLFGEGGSPAERSAALKRRASLLDSLSDEIARLNNGIAEHAAQFRKVVQLHEQLGLDEKSGLQGALRAAVHEVETKLKEANLESLTIKMLMMRRHEKDFMLRGAEKYVGRIESPSASRSAIGSTSRFIRPTNSAWSGGSPFTVSRSSNAGPVRPLM